MKHERRREAQLQARADRTRPWWARPLRWVALLVGLVVAGLLALSVGGCATLERPEELAYQALNATDMVLTAQNVRDPCIEEGNPLTRAVVGRNPSAGSLALFGAASGVAHLGVSHLLRETGHPRLYAVWQVVTITNAGLGVGWNLDIKSRRCGK